MTPGIRYILLLVFCAAIAGLTASQVPSVCNADTVATAPAPLESFSIAPAPPPMKRTLGPEDSGREVDIAVGGEVVLGFMVKKCDVYGYSIKEMDIDVLKLENRTAENVDKDRSLTFWYFRAVRPGVTKLTLSPEKEGLRPFSLTVTVEEAR
ncbi:MAG: hypothetical protein HZA22_05970 [Nitrospirae bacterium]|nr:hypothetical protein [Nitrospirota bacterium]